MILRNEKNHFLNFQNSVISMESYKFTVLIKIRY